VSLFVAVSLVSRLSHGHGVMGLKIWVMDLALSCRIHSFAFYMLKAPKLIIKSSIRGPFAKSQKRGQVRGGAVWVPGAPMCYVPCGFSFSLLHSSLGTTFLALALAKDSTRLLGNFLVVASRSRFLFSFLSSGPVGDAAVVEFAGCSHSCSTFPAMLLHTCLLLLFFSSSSQRQNHPR
jgi:hypothetical protein